MAVMRNLNPALLLICFALVVPACGNNGSATGADLGSGGDLSTTVGECTAARAQLLGAIDTVSTGEVDLLSSSGASKTILSTPRPAASAAAPRTRGCS